MKASTTLRKFPNLLLLAAYAAMIPAANWLIQNVGNVQFPGGPHVLPVGFGYSAPSGFLAIGVSLVLRDLIQRRMGSALALVAVVLGAALTWLVAPSFAVASLAGYAIGEAFDFLSFTATHRLGLGLPVGVLISGIVGGLLDSLIFLRVAFGSTAYWQGQFIGKTLVALVAACIILLVHVQSAHSEGGKT